MINRRISSRRTKGWLITLLVGVGVLLAACSTPAASTFDPQTECPECPQVTCPEVPAFEELWLASGHADEMSEAFTHWDDSDPQEIPADCAKCHSRPGYLDFLGADETEAGVVQSAVEVGTTLTCYVCHNEVTEDMDRVAFSSGVRIPSLGAETICVECHQGLAWSGSVDLMVLERGMGGDDTSSDALEFVDSHYAAAAVIFGTEVEGGFEYEGRAYRIRLLRADEFFSCSRCHDQHSLEVSVENCRECHTDIVTMQDIRVDTTDFDGDGDTFEGVAGEITTFRDALYTAMQVYAVNVTGVPIVYNTTVYPFFFIDTDGNGAADPSETVVPNKYNAWTPRLLQAAYNLNFVSKDPGAFAHNADYAIQVLYDSLSDIGGDMTGMTRPR